MEDRQNVLIIRFSAMGDVAMTAPVVKQIAQQNPNTQFIYLTRPFFKPFFSDIPNLNFRPFNPKDYKGLVGLYRLYSELKKLNITAVADLHFNLRSRIISLFFKTAGIKVANLDKGRAEKKALTRKTNKILQPLTPMWFRYAVVFKALGFQFSIKNELLAENKKPIDPEVQRLTGAKTDYWVGISPFAQHLQKIYPLNKLEEVIKALSEANIRTFIFGGGNDEKSIAEKWQENYPDCFSVVGKITLEQELNLISQLDVMMSMDSAGMHLASLTSTKVVSVWGATHPFAGFLGFGQSKNDCIQSELYCRPCSVYGNKPCFRGDLACMQMIEPQQIINKTLHLLKTHEQKITTSTPRKV